MNAHNARTAQADTAAMLPTQPLDKAQRFFFDNAGYSWNPRKETPAQGRTRGAMALRAAEQAYSDAEAYASVEFCVWPDEIATYEDGEQRYMMAIRDGDGHTMNSCGAMDSEDSTQRRIMHAELALDILAELRELTAAELTA